MCIKNDRISDLCDNKILIGVLINFKRERNGRQTLFRHLLLIIFNEDSQIMFIFINCFSIVWCL